MSCIIQLFSEEPKASKVGDGLQKPFAQRWTVAAVDIDKELLRVSQDQDCSLKYSQQLF